MRQSKLPLPCIAVLATMATYANADGGSIHPSQARLAGDLGVGTRTIRQWIRRGVDTGWIVENQRGIGYHGISRPSVYSLTIPDVIQQSRKDASPSAGQNEQERSNCSGDRPREAQERSGSTGDDGQNRKDSAASVWELAEKEIARAREAGRSCDTTGMTVQESRQDSATYQRNTNSSSTQVPRSLKLSKPSDVEPPPEGEAAMTEPEACESMFDRFAQRQRENAARKTEAKPIRYQTRHSSR
jgi:hypothetical protein